MEIGCVDYAAGLKGLHPLHDQIMLPWNFLLELLFIMELLTVLLEYIDRNNWLDIGDCILTIPNLCVHHYQ